MPSLRLEPRETSGFCLMRLKYSTNSTSKFYIKCIRPVNQPKFYKTAVSFPVISEVLKKILEKSLQFASKRTCVSGWAEEWRDGQRWDEEYITSVLENG